MDVCTRNLRQVIASHSSSAHFGAFLAYELIDYIFFTIGVWGIIVTGAIAYQWGKNIPTQLKIIHSRIIAQGAMLSGCFLAAIVHFAVDEPKRAVTKKEEFMNQGIRLRNYDVKAPPMSPTASEMK